MVEELQISFKEGTDVGKVRDHNEDCVLIPAVSEAERKSKGQLFIVADGMGGYQAGEVASEIAARVVAQQYYADPSDDPTARLRNAVQAANAEVHHQAQGDVARIGMGTTMVVTALVGRKAYIASVGDSRAYHVHAGQITQVTQDHSFVGEQVRAGILTKEQARLHPQRNVITRALGSQPTVSVDTFSGDLSDGDVLVMCTDGLTGHVPDEPIRDTVLQLPPDQAVQKLIQMANAGGGSDNISVIVLRAEPPVTAKMKPVTSVDSTVAAAPLPVATAAPSARPAAAKAAARPAKRGRSTLTWAVGGVLLALSAVVVIGASVVVFRMLPSGNPKVTPSAPAVSPQVPPTVTALVPVAVPSTTPTAGPTATLAHTSTPTLTRTRIPPAIAPTLAETSVPEVTLTPSATETPKPDKDDGSGGKGKEGG